MDGGAQHGLYHALGLSFAAELNPDDVKKAYRKMSLKFHPDRNRGENAEHSKQMFQVVNEAFNTLSVPELRAEYDGLFRMRCVLEQGSLTEARLREQPLDLTYMFAVTHRKGLGMREESVLIVNLQDGLAAGRIERWRGGDAIDQRPLSALRAAELEGAASRDVKLQLQDEAGKQLPSLTLSARSAADAASICALLHALRSALLARDEARLRRDDGAMPPPPVQQGWLTIKLAGQGHALSRPFRAFAMLGRSKLLLFADRTCRALRSLLTLESGSLQVSHTAGELELELTIGKFRMVAMADSAFVADQWAQAITDGIFCKGLFLDPCAPEACAGSRSTSPTSKSAAAKPAPTGETKEDGRPVFGFPNGQPEAVDWLGQKSQIDAAIAQGPGTHVVICSSMGGTDPNHMLNSLGRETLEDGSTRGGDILKWKRKAEAYLVASGLPWTVVHPGGLVNEEGGVRALCLGVDDVIKGTENRNVPREDVAEVLVQSLLLPALKNRAVDLVSKPEGEGAPPTDWTAWAESELKELAAYDYTLGEVA